jgi:hypothetical protein
MYCHPNLVASRVSLLAKICKTPSARESQIRSIATLRLCNNLYHVKVRTPHPPVRAQGARHQGYIITRTSSLPSIAINE